MTLTLRTVPALTPVRRAHHSRVAALVDHILGRHGRGYAAVSPLDRVLRLQRPGVAVNRHQHIHRPMFLRLAFAPRTPPPPIQRAAAATPGWWRAMERVVTETRRETTREVATLIERLVARERRIETRVESPPPMVAITKNEAASTAPAAVPPFRAADMFVVRRSPTVSSAQEHATPEPAAAALRPVPVTAEGSRRQPAVGAASMPIPLSPAELGRLTDEVVRSIDRRLVSYRERHGEI